MHVKICIFIENLTHVSMVIAGNSGHLCCLLQISIDCGYRSSDFSDVGGCGSIANGFNKLIAIILWLAQSNRISVVICTYI